MLVYVHGAKCVGIEAVPVTVEVNINLGIGIHLVGLADAAVKESLLRTVTALQSQGFRIPGKKIVINLAPADMHKQGSGYDLPIALGIIAASEQRALPLLDRFLIMGELGLDGSVRPVSGALPMAELAAGMGLRGCILPEASARASAAFTDTPLYGVSCLGEVLQLLGAETDPEALRVQAGPPDPAGGPVGVPPHPEVDFADILGQETAKRGLEIAAAGGHNVIMIGPPGAGKSSLAKAIAGILPPMTPEEALVTAKVYSVAGRREDALLRHRPFRAPHISASQAALLGGGNGENILPGEVSLSTNGVLFLDEFCEAPKTLVESLRAPMEDRQVTISRLRSKVVYPASFMLVAASNPCPCGYYGEGNRCRCSVGQRLAYMGRLSGPLMDRIDVQLCLHPVPTGLLLRGGKAEPSTVVAGRVQAARALQQRRLAGSGLFVNAEMTGREIEAFCPLDEAGKHLLEGLVDKLGLSARSYTRIVKLARTIADLAGVPDILPEHLAEAASYRFLDRGKGMDF